MGLCSDEGGVNDEVRVVTGVANLIKNIYNNNTKLENFGDFLEDGIPKFA